MFIGVDPLFKYIHFILSINYIVAFNLFTIATYKTLKNGFLLLYKNVFLFYANAFLWGTLGNTDLPST